MPHDYRRPIVADWDKPRISYEVSKLHRAAEFVVTRRFPQYNFHRVVQYSGCCYAMDTTNVAWRVVDAFAAKFRPSHRPRYWWPEPSTKNKGRASNGKTYKPSEARCLALLLMAEMVRTGDV